MLTSSVIGGVVPGSVPCWLSSQSRFSTWYGVVRTEMSVMGVLL
jgi:hypothetical protein